jgi:hypothetical protein
MRRDSFAAGFWCALAVAIVILVADLRRPETIPDEQRPQIVPRTVTIEPTPLSQTPEPPPIVAADVRPSRGVMRPAVIQHREPVPEEREVEREIRYAGNRKSHKFHELTCRYATCPNCTARFATRAAAMREGFIPGGCCNP